MHSAYQAQQASHGALSATGLVFAPPPPYEPVTVESVEREIGLVREFFRQKLKANRDEALVEDEELPAKQKFPKPRLPPTGKISSPRKRPIREQQQMAKKRRKLEEAGEGRMVGGKPVGVLKLTMPERRDGPGEEPEKDGAGGAMISPESISGN